MAEEKHFQLDADALDNLEWGDIEDMQNGDMKRTREIFAKILVGETSESLRGLKLREMRALNKEVVAAIGKLGTLGN